MGIYTEPLIIQYFIDTFSNLLDSYSNQCYNKIIIGDFINLSPVDINMKSFLRKKRKLLV